MKLSTIIQDVVDASKGHSFFETHLSIYGETLAPILEILSKTDEFKECELELMTLPPTEGMSKVITVMLHENTKFTGKVKLYSFCLGGGMDSKSDPHLLKEPNPVRCVMMRGIIENLEGIGDGEKMNVTLSKS